MDEDISPYEIDMYGFSLIGTLNSRNQSDFIEESGYNVLNSFKKDENWNNPQAVELMMKSYGISDSFICHDQPCIQSFTYLSLKEEQGKLFCSRFVAEGKKYLRDGKVRDSLNSFNTALTYDASCTEAYILRLEIFDNLGMVSEALVECKSILKISHQNSKALEYLNRRRSMLKESSKCQDLAKNEIDLTTTIDKLRMSMQKEKTHDGGSEYSKSEKRRKYYDTDSENDGDSTTTASKQIKKKRKKEKREKKASKKSKKNEKDSKRKKKSKGKSRRDNLSKARTSLSPPSSSDKDIASLDASIAPQQKDENDAHFVG